MVVSTKQPHLITEVISKSKVLSKDGDDYEVAVHWGLHEAQALTTLKYSAPSPLVRDYVWTGKLKPFAHQKETAAFLTLNQKAFCFSEAGCVDSDTEYLSPTGWVKISDYAGGDVAQYHPDTGAMEFVSPTEYVKLPCADMVRVKTKYGLDQLLSPEHRVLLVDGKKKEAKQEVTSAAELLRRHDADHAGFKHELGGCKAGTTTIAFSGAAIPTVFSAAGGEGVPLSDEALRLQIAVHADGHFSKKSTTTWCTVRLKRPQKVARMRQLLEGAGVTYTETVPEYESAKGFHIFKFNAPVRSKSFGAEYWAASPYQLGLVADEVLYWDGTNAKNNKCGMYRTCDKPSADFIQYAFCATGRTARIAVFDRAKRESIDYVVTVRDTQRLYIKARTKATVWAEPSTDGFKYCFMVPSTFLIFRRNGCVFASGNTGKTASVIWAADYLMKLGKIKRVLVVCPMSIMKAAWQQDLFRFAMHRSCSVAHGSADTRAKIIKAGAEFVIINYDGLATVKDELIAGGFDLIVADEATALKNPMTNRWKTFKAVCANSPWLWLLTGTPAAQSPVDAYGLAKLVNPNGVSSYFGGFRDKVMYKVTQFSWAPRPEAKEIVHEALQPAIRFEKKDCLDLPLVTHVERDAPLTPQQRKFYDKMHKQMRIEAAGETITAVNAGAKINKLLQISCGASYDDAGGVIEFDVSNRINVVLEVIEEASNKVLIFAPFTHTIDLLKTTLEKHKISCAVLAGNVSMNARSDAVKAFQETPDPRVLIIQPQAAAHGLTLTAADTIIWYAPVTSVETYLQANARNDRPGQRNPMTVVHIKGSEVEAKLYAMLRNKVSNHTKIVDLYRSEIGG